MFGGWFSPRKGEEAPQPTAEAGQQPKQQQAASELPSVPAFFKALQDGEIRIVRQWVDGNGDIDQRFPIQVLNAWNDTPLIVAAMWGHIEVVTLLLNAGANIEAVNHSGHTALITAASQGEVEVVKLLLEWKANVQAKSVKVDRTALDMAKLRSESKPHRDVVAILAPLTNK